LRGAGMGEVVLRQLLDLELLAQRLEDFVLTDAGAAWVRRLDLNGAAVVIEVRRAEANRGLPCYDTERRKLRLGGWLVKRLRQRAGNQELVLLGFQEVGWARALDDPLPRDPDIDPFARLRETIRRLNQNQRDARILFQGDGTGCRVLWS